MSNSKLIAGAVVAAGVVLAAASGRRSDGTPKAEGGDMPALPQSNMVGLRNVMAATGLPVVWADFLRFVAAGESGGNNLVGLGDPLRMPPWTRTHQDYQARVARAHAEGKPPPALTELQRREASAAAVAYARATWQRGYWDARWYTFGSGGWFGTLPSNGLAVFRGQSLGGRSLEAQHPWLVFDPGCSVVMALGMIRRLQGWAQWKAGPRTAAMLRIGWVLPAKMSDAAWFEANRRERYERHARAAGLPASFVDQPMPNLSTLNVPAMMERVQAAVWLPKTTVA